jgi:hypothetical protein
MGSLLCACGSPGAPPSARGSKKPVVTNAYNAKNHVDTPTADGSRDHRRHIHVEMRGTMQLRVHHRAPATAVEDSSVPADFEVAQR